MSIIHSNHCKIPAPEHGSTTQRKAVVQWGILPPYRLRYNLLWIELKFNSA
ncbi:MAG: hypothetical protein LBJ00_16290 [Planctomycetaceae bacterium]|nr:hypothetical protein [Planctomycetaceae bacterium]